MAAVQNKGCRIDRNYRQSGLEMWTRRWGLRIVCGMNTVCHWIFRGISFTAVSSPSPLLGVPPPDHRILEFFMYFQTR